MLYFVCMLPFLFVRRVLYVFVRYVKCVFVSYVHSVFVRHVQCVFCVMWCIYLCVMCCMYLCVCCGFLRAPSPSGIKQVPHTGSGGTTTHRRTDITRRLACQKTNPTQEDPNWAFLGVHQRLFLKNIVTTSCGGQDQEQYPPKRFQVSWFKIQP